MTTTVTVDTTEHEVLFTRVADGRPSLKTKFPVHSRSTLHLWSGASALLEELPAKENIE